MAEGVYLTQPTPWPSAAKLVGLLESIAIPVLFVTEQRQVVRYLDNLRVRVDAFRRLQESTQAELAALLPAVLDKAFRGKL